MMSPVDTHPYFFYIAKDEQGIRDLEYGDLYQEHLLQIPVKYQDIDNSWNLIFALNEELSLLIDIYEDEQIDVNKLPKNRFVLLVYLHAQFSEGGKFCRFVNNPCIFKPCLEAGNLLYAQQFVIPEGFGRCQEHIYPFLMYAKRSVF